MYSKRVHLDKKLQFNQPDRVNETTLIRKIGLRFTIGYFGLLPILLAIYYIQRNKKPVVKFGWKHVYKVMLIMSDYNFHKYAN